MYRPLAVSRPHGGLEETAPALWVIAVVGCSRRGSPSIHHRPGGGVRRLVGVSAPGVWGGQVRRMPRGMLAPERSARAGWFEGGGRAGIGPPDGSVLTSDAGTVGRATVPRSSQGVEDERRQMSGRGNRDPTRLPQIGRGLAGKRLTVPTTLNERIRHRLRVV